MYRVFKYPNDDSYEYIFKKNAWYKRPQCKAEPFVKVSEEDQSKLSVFFATDMRVPMWNISMTTKVVGLIALTGSAYWFYRKYFNP